MQASNPTPNTQRNLDDIMVPPGSTPSPSSDLATPITIAMIGIISTAITLTLYQLLVLKFCAQRDSPASHLHEISSGVDQKVLNSIPIQAYSHKQRASGASDQCAVCLGEFEEGDPVRLLPNCHHLFHLQCIDVWFASHSSCPICRSPVVAPPTSPVLPVITDVNATGSLPQQSLNHQGSIVIFVEENDSVSAHSRKIINSAASPSLCVEKEPQTRFLPPLLKRSLSDCSFISAKTCLQHEHGPTSLKVLQNMRCSSWGRGSC